MRTKILKLLRRTILSKMFHKFLKIDAGVFIIVRIRPNLAEKVIIELFHPIFRTDIVNKFPELFLLKDPIFVLVIMLEVILSAFF